MKRSAAREVRAVFPDGSVEVMPPSRLFVKPRTGAGSDPDRTDRGALLSAKRWTMPWQYETRKSSMRPSASQTRDPGKGVKFRPNTTITITISRRTTPFGF